MIWHLENSFVRKGIFPLLLLLLVSSDLMGQARTKESDFVYARRLYEDGLYDLASGALQRYLEADPEGPHAFEANFLIGESRTKEKKYELARQAYQRAAMVDPDDPRAVESLIRVGDTYMEEGEWYKAVRAYERVPVFYPSSPLSPEALTRAGEILVEHELFTEAEVPLQQILRQYPESTQQRKARLLWARVLADRGDLDAAAEEAGQVAEATRDENLAVEALSFQGDWYWRLGRDPEAEAAWRKILVRYPRAGKRGEALTRMGEQRLRIGDAEQSEELLRDALRSLREGDEMMSRVRLSLGDAMLLLGKSAGALEQYSRLPKTDPTIAFRRALALEFNGRNSEAIEAYGIIGEGTGDIAIGARWRLAELQEKAQRHRDAAEAWKATERKLTTDLLKSETRYRTIKQTLLVEPLRALEMAEAYSDEFPRAARVDEVEMLRVEALLALERRREALKALQDLITIWPASPYVHDARWRAGYMQQYVVTEGDPSSKLAGLVAEFAGGRDRRDLSLRLAEVYMRDMKDFSSAREQLANVLNDKELDDQRKAQARALLAETVWGEYLRLAYGDTGRLTADAGRRRAAAKAGSTELEKLLPDLTEPVLKATTSWRIVQLEAATRSGQDSVLYVRKALQDHLADYPESPAAGDAYLALGKAFSIAVPGVDDPTKGDASIWYLEVFRDDYRDHPRYSEGLLLLANRYAQAKRFAPAEETYNLVLRLGKTPERVQAALRLIDPNYSKIGAGAAEALEWVRTEAFYHPEVQASREALIDKLIKEKRYTDAMSELEAMSELNMDWGPGLVIEGARDQKLAHEWGMVYEGLGQIDRARDEYRRYLAHHPSGAEADEIRLRLASLRLSQGYLDAALRHYRRLLNGKTSEDVHSAALRGAAQILFKQGQYEAAQRYAEEVAAKGTPRDTAFVYDELATACLYRQGKLDDGRKSANRFRKTWSRHEGLYNASARFELERGMWLSKAKKYPDAEAHYKRLLNRYENSTWVPEAKYEWGRDLLEQNRFEDGLDLLTSLPESYPGHKILGQVWWVLGNYYAQHGNIMDATQTYDKVLKDSTYVDIWPYVLVNQIRAYRGAGFYAGALQAAQRYLELYPDAPDSFDRQLDVGLMFLQMGQYDLAIQQFRKIQPLADVENEAATQFYIAEAMEKAGRLSESVIEYKKVDYLGKQTKMQWAITALYNAGRVLERLGEPNRAIDMYQEIVRREGLASPFGRRAKEQIERIQSERG